MATLQPRADLRSIADWQVSGLQRGFATRRNVLDLLPDSDRIRQIVRAVLADKSSTLRIPTSALPQSAPKSLVSGRGITPLFLGLMLRLAGHRVEVLDHGWDPQTRLAFASLTEVGAAPGPDKVRSGTDEELVSTINAAGVALMQRFVQDNPSLGKHIASGVVHAVPRGEGADGFALCRESFAHDEELIDHMGCAAKPPEWTEGVVNDVEEELLQCIGHVVAVQPFMKDFIAQLKQAGVLIHSGVIDEATLDHVAKDTPVITVGQDAKARDSAVWGWQLQVPARGGEGGQAVKIRYEAPLGVVESGRLGADLNVVGGEVPPQASEEARAKARDQFLACVEKHFPQSLADVRPFEMHLSDRRRPARDDGQVRLERHSTHRINCVVPEAGEFTQAPAVALLAVRSLQ